MRTQILIPTDFSSNAFNAVEYAFQMFRDKECTFHLYHAYFIVTSTEGNPMFPVPNEFEYRAARQNISSRMDALKKKVFELPKNEKHQLKFDFEYGFLTDFIKQKVNSEKIDIVIMGTRGATDDKKVAYGRNAIDVMERVRTCPVLAIPAKVRYKELGEIVFPTDFKRKNDLKEMQTFKKIVQISNSPIRILHIGNESALDSRQIENKRLLGEQLDPCEYSFHWLPNVELLEGLLRFVKERESSMICFVNRKHWFFGSIFSNPLIKDLGVHSTVPLLALHGQ